MPLPPHTTESDGDALCEGVVISAQGGVAQVEMSDEEQCKTCVSKGSCHMGTRGSRVISVTTDELKKGDRVRIYLQSTTVLKASFMLYLLPTLLVIIGAFAGAAVFSSFLGLSSDVGSLVGVVIGLALAWLFVHFYNAGQAGREQTLRVEKID